MSVSATSSPVFAASTTNNVFDENKIITRMDELGIEKTVQDNLIEKIKNGELLDSENPEKVKQAAKYLKVSKQNPIAEYTFEDGSKIVKGIIIEKEEISPHGIITTTATPFYDSAFIDAEFKAKIILNTDYPASSILSVYDSRITITFGDYSNDVLSIIKPTQSGSTPAHARLAFKYQYQAPGWNVRSGTAWLELFVADINWWDDFIY